MISEKIIIAGVCSTDSERQTFMAAIMVKTAVCGVLGEVPNVFLRSPMTKQPTFPPEDGWRGPGLNGFRWLLNACKEFNLIPSTEITSAREARSVVRECERTGQTRVHTWTGARLADGREIQAIASTLSELPEGILGIKNPPQENERDWKGRVEWARQSKLNQKNIHLIHRGFNKNNGDNPQDLRNVPNHELALRLSTNFGLPILLDPSHAGGEPQKVIQVLRDAPLCQYDGIMIEASPTRTRTDEKQRLGIGELITALTIFKAAVL